MTGISCPASGFFCSLQRPSHLSHNDRLSYCGLIPFAHIVCELVCLHLYSHSYRLFFCLPPAGHGHKFSTPVFRYPGDFVLLCHFLISRLFSIESLRWTRNSLPILIRNFFFLLPARARETGSSSRMGCGVRFWRGKCSSFQSGCLDYKRLC